MKASADYYLQYVSMQKLPHNELASNFIAMCIKSEISALEQSNKISNQLRIVDFFMNDITKRSSMSFKGMVNTKSNLSSAVFQNIVLSLGIDYSFYQTKAVLIDEKLLKSRNEIAHGNYLLISDSEYIEIHEKILEIMEHFRSQIDNSASTKAYRRP